MRNNIYFNHDDIFVEIPIKFRDKFLECHKTEPCRSNKEALAYLMITCFGIKH